MVAQKGVVDGRARGYRAPVRRVGVIATVLGALVLAPAAGAGTVGVARTTPGVLDLMV